MTRALQRIVWSLTILALWLNCGRACLADSGGKVGGGVEPAFVGCISSKSGCKNVVRTQFRIQYTRYVTRTSSVRMRLLTAYQLILDDDRDQGASEEQQVSRLNPPFDVIDFRWRSSEPNGRDRFEARTGYSYQHSNPSVSDGYHALYISSDYYFGPPIPLGKGSLSRRLDLSIRVAQTTFAAANRSTEQTLQFGPIYTIPVTSDGATRVYGSYARELRFSGSNRVRTPSNRFEIGVTRKATRWLQFYGRISLFGTRNTPGATKLILGLDFTF